MEDSLETFSLPFMISPTRGYSAITKESALRQGCTVTQGIRRAFANRLEGHFQHTSCNDRESWRGSFPAQALKNITFFEIPVLVQFCGSCCRAGQGRAGRTFPGKLLHEAAGYSSWALQCSLAFVQKAHPTCPPGYFPYLFCAFPPNRCLTFLLHAPGLPQHCWRLGGAHVVSSTWCGCPVRQRCGSRSRSQLSMEGFCHIPGKCCQVFWRTWIITWSLGHLHYLLLITCWSFSMCRLMAFSLRSWCKPFSFAGVLGALCLFSLKRSPLTSHIVLRSLVAFRVNLGILKMLLPLG